MHSNLTIQNELKELNSILAGIPNTNVYTVPDGYFEAMVLDVMHTIQQEPGMAGTNGSVPDGYFEGLAASIMNKIKSGAVEEEGSSLLSSLKSINTYTVPQGYFDSLAGNVMDKINASEAEEESELLYSVKGINPYKVPEGYFDGLATDIVSKLPQPAKIIVMQKRPSIFRYAAAAVITGIIGLSVISVIDNRQPENTVDQVAVTGSNASSDKSFDDAVAKISDEDILAYLKTSGDDVNAALVASATEGKNLPEELDYMTDDKTLDNFLNELNINKDKPANN